MTQKPAAIDPTVADRAAQPYFGTRHEVAGDIRAVVDVAFPALFTALGERGIAPTGPPLLRVLEVDPAGEPLRIEVGAPVAPEADPGVEVLPAGRYLTHLHVGPYRSDTEVDLGDARAALVAWAEEIGVILSRPTERGREFPCAFDSFRRGPVETSDFMTWETELAYLIVDA